VKEAWDLIENYCVSVDHNFDLDEKFQEACRNDATEGEEE
jgi:hypothetical protein